MDDSGGVLTIPMQPMQPPQGFQTFQRPNARTFQRRGPPSDAKGGAQDGDTSTGPVMFDGKRMRKAVHRKTVDYNSAVVQYLENRVWQRDYRDMRAIQPDSLYQIDIPPPIAMINNSMNCVTTKFIRASTNKFRCPIFCLAWTPEGRRLVTGASSGEFTLWNGLTFNFETILQAHDTSCRAMQWSHNDNWMVTADHFGYIKYWQSNMNNVKMYQGHKEPIRGIRYQHLHMDLLSSRIHGNSVHLFLCGYVPSRATALRCSNELHHSGSSHCEVSKCLVMGIFPVTCVLCHLEVLIIQCSRLSALLNVLLVLYLINQADSREVTGKISYFVIGG